jgi:glycosyltransferase involved in cell wall biosynthesis
MSAGTASLPRPRPSGAAAARRAENGRPLAILHLITRLERGGSSDCTLWQAIGAARRGHRVTVACGPSPVPTPLLARAREAPGIRFVAVKGLARPIRPFADLRALLAIIAILRRERFDIVHTHTSKAGALGRLAAALCGFRSVIHQPHGHLFYGYYGRSGSALVALAERLLAPLARVQVTLSRRGALEHLGRGIGEPGRFRVIPSGIDLRPFRGARRRRATCRERLGFAADEFWVGTLCRLEPVKGVDVLLHGFLRAAASRPALRLFLGGDGPLRAALERRAAGAGASSRVAFAGAWVAPEEVLPALDLFVLASRNEGMGRALVEAMACGLPVIATDVGGVAEVLEEGRAGRLVPSGDPEAVAAAIGRLADAPDLRAAVGRRARARAVRFGAGRMTRDLLRLYREVAG